MTVPAATSSIVYTADGTTAVFPYTWEIAQSADLIVYTVGVGGTVATKLALTSGYTVSGVGIATGGNVTLVAGNPAVGVRVFIASDPALIQQLLLEQGIAMNPADIMAALDLLTRQVQAVRRLANGALQFPVAESLDGVSSTFPTKALRANKYAGFDGGGGAAVLSGSFTGIPVETTIQVLDTIALLKAVAVPAAAVTYLVRGYAAAGDGAGGIYRWNAADTSADNGGTVISPASLPGTGRWNLVSGLLTTLDVREFGAKGDGVTDDTVAINAAIGVLVALGRGVLTFAGKSYLISAGLLITGLSDFLIDGQGATIKVANGTACVYANRPLALSGCSRGVVANLTIDGNRANRTPAANAQDSNLEITGCTDIAFTRVFCKNAVRDGIYIDTLTPGTLSSMSSGLTFTACKADNAYRNGMSVIGGTKLAFIACQFTNSIGTSPEAGVDLESDVGYANGAIDGVRFTDCDFSGNNGYGLSMADQSQPRNVVVTGNRFTANAAGALLIAARDVSVQGNQFHDFTAATRGIIDIPSPAINALWNRNIVIEGNVFRAITAALKYAIYVHGSSGGRVRILGNDFVSCVGGVNANVEHVEIIGNRFDTLSRNAIEYDGAKYGRIASNTFRSGASYSIYCDATSDYMQVIDNTFIDCPNTLAGATNGNVYVAAPNVRVAGNSFALIAAPDATAIAVLADSATCTAEIVGNRCVGFSTNSAIAATNSAVIKVTGLNPGWGEGTAVIDPASLAGGAEQTLATITVPGAALGDLVTVAAPYDLQGCIVSGYVSAANTVTIRQRNGTVGAIDLASGTWKARIQR